MPRAGRLAAPDASATAQSKLCGSVVTVDVRMADGVVVDYAQDVHACLLGQCSAAVMGANIVGSTPEELRQVGGQMRRMLRGEGPAPGGRWADLAVLESVRDYKARHASTLLAFDAVEAALAEIEAREGV
ncbi:MAG: iron-sulfur cluster assembly scaffold protein [Hyphomicrobiales bacterium]|nr:iron-sulfur cluster assembly scaffold protein [Hyphomicrobiales bacterium]